MLKAMKEKTIILDEKAMQRAVSRITYEILERNHGAEQLCIIGILSRGKILGERIVQKIYELEKVQVAFCPLDITPFRDDRTENIESIPNGISIPVQDRTVIIIDDVLYTGRSCRAAMDAILRVGRPRCIQLGVLIDRGHRELPIRPDYVGKNVPTSQTEQVRVFTKETDGSDYTAIFE